MKILKAKVPMVYSLAFLIVGIAIPLAIFKYSGAKSLEAITNIEPSKNEVSITSAPDCTVTSSRLKGFEYIKPLMEVRAECEAQKMIPLKSQLQSIIDGEKAQGHLMDASVFIKDCNTNDWISINGTSNFYPGSLIKLPMMIAILKMSEANPSLLDKKVTYNSGAVFPIKQTFGSKTVEPGHTYTVRELLKYMICYSDNGATQLLNPLIDADKMNELFKALGGSAPENNVNYFKYTVNAPDFSNFMSLLYNAGYLDITLSEYASEMLAQSDFKEGIVKGLPAGTKIAHKFGEAGHPGEHELHETAIVYLKNSAYLITVMTRGADIKYLPNVMGSISKATYDHFKGLDI